MMPDEEVLMNMGIGNISIDGITLDIAAMLKTINARIEFLYDREHTIGHAFFMELVNEPTIDKLASIFMKSIMYVYSKRYGTADTWLLYPVNNKMRNHKQISFESEDGTKVSIFFVDVAAIEDSLNLLKKQITGNLL